MEMRNRLNRVVLRRKREYYRQKTLESSMPIPLNKLYSFQHVNVEEVRTIVIKANLTYCDSDPLPTSDVLRCENFCDILNTFTAIINCSLLNNSFPDSEKLAVITPIIIIIFRHY